MSVVTVNKSSQTTQCCESQQHQGQSHCWLVCIFNRSNSVKRPFLKGQLYFSSEGNPFHGMNPPYRFPYVLLPYPSPLPHSPFCHVIYAPLTAQPRPGGRECLSISLPQSASPVWFHMSTQLL